MFKSHTLNTTGASDRSGAPVFGLYSNMKRDGNPDDTEALAPLRHELLELANERFPAVAKTGGYPVHLNHCFLRIVYDNTLGARWDTVLPKGRPAYKQLDQQQLHRALAIGYEITESPARCRELNAVSLAMRGRPGSPVL